MNACIDVSYRTNYAIAACLLFAEWGDAVPADEIVARIDQVEAYVPGAFYRRELPCIQAVLAKVQVPLSVIVIDGYVWLAGEEKPGLGAHLHAAIAGKVPVIGVAKKYFRGATATEVQRGNATHSLYVTAVGMALTDAARVIQQMHGPHRIPTLLKRVDPLCRVAEVEKE